MNPETSFWTEVIAVLVKGGLPTILLAIMGWAYWKKDKSLEVERLAHRTTIEKGHERELLILKEQSKAIDHYTSIMEQVLQVFKAGTLK